MVYSTPGVYIETGETNVNATDLVTPSICYMFGTAVSGTLVATVDTPVAISNLTDFVTKFGSDSPSYNHVRMFFNQVPRSLYFVNVSVLADALASITVSDEMGITIAPELIEGSLDVAAATVIANQLIAHAEATRNFTIIDPHPSIKNTVGATDSEGIRAYRLGINDSFNAALYFPYLTDNESNELAPSSAMAGLYIRTFTNEGVAQSPASFNRLLSGVSSPTYAVNLPTDSDILNPLGVNIIIKKPRFGVAAYGSRTMGTTLRFINTSMILITQERALAEAYESLMFETIDTRGELFRRAKAIGTGILTRQWSEGQMIGATPVDSFTVICDATNNTTESLQLGTLKVDIYQSPAGTVEIVVITTHQVPFGTLSEVIANR